MKTINFKYNPKARENKIIEKRPKWLPIKCECCGNKVLEYTDGFLKSKRAVGIICLDCIATGRAAREYNGTFVPKFEEGIVNDEFKIEELTKRTPGYISFNESFWLACCEDFCEYLGETTEEFLSELGILDELIDECIEKFLTNDKGTIDKEFIIDEFGDFVIGHLFRCLHCGKYRLYIEFDINGGVDFL